jgi:hypothetical protein
LADPEGTGAGVADGVGFAGAGAVGGVAEDAAGGRAALAAGVALGFEVAAAIGDHASPGLRCPLLGTTGAADPLAAGGGVGGGGGFGGSGGFPVVASTRDTSHQFPSLRTALSHHSLASAPRNARTQSTG